MDDSPLLSAPEAPLDPHERDRWLQARADELDDLIAAELRRIIGISVDEFIAGLAPDSPEALTAAADFTVFDAILPRWEEAVRANILPFVGEYYLSGALNAAIVAPGFAAVAPEVAARWAAVVNTQAQEWALSRTPVLLDVAPAVRADIAGKVASAIQSGLSTEGVAAQVQELIGASEYRASVIARTEVQAAYENGNYEAADALDEFKPVEKIWVATLDDRTREAHLAMDNVVVAWDDDFDVPANDDGDDAARMRAPMDMSAPLSQWIQCRCVHQELYRGMLRPDGSRAGIDPL